MKDKIILSHQDTQRFQELAFDRKATEDTLNVALLFHHNQVNSLNKTKEKLWQHVSEAYGIELKETTFTASYDELERRFCITETKEKS